MCNKIFNNLTKYSQKRKYYEELIKCQYLLLQELSIQNSDDKVINLLRDM